MPPLDQQVTFRDHPPKAYAVPQLEKGCLYKGIVTGSVLPNNLVTVKVDGLNITVQALWAAGIFSGLLGFKTSFLPPINTSVILLFTGEDIAYIIGCHSGITIDPGNQARASVDPDANYHSSQTFAVRNSKKAPVMAAQKPPIDLAEGEFQIDNMLGVGLTFLRNLASMQAGDLARVECHILDDMVRIISNTFRHHSAVGDCKIFNDGGKLNAIWRATSHDHEALGLLRKTDAKAEFTKNNPDKVDFTNVDGFADEGRWRFQQYVGWLGDFINIFVTDPVNAIGRLASDQLKSGKFRCHVNNDGSLLVQSVADIVLEKVVRIPVPVEIRRENDPNGNRTDDSVRGNEFLKTWKPSSNNIFEMVFQLRDYARWLNNSYSLGRFRQLDRDYRVPTEAETPSPDVNSSEPDRLSVNGSTSNWSLAYSSIRIYRDGSIQTVDAYGNSFTSTKTGIQISSTRDILIQAAGSINLVAGRDLNLLARKNVGITAITEKVRIKAETGLQMLTRAGNVLLETVNNFVVKLVGNLNVNNAVHLGRDGSINALGTVSGLRFAADLTMPNGEGPHLGHIFPGGPIVPVVTDEFKFQDNYDPDSLYETISQQMIRQGDQTANVTWNFDDNAIGGKGSPWPGAGKQHKVYNGGQNLSSPSSQSSFTNTPSSMTDTAIQIKAQT